VIASRRPIDDQVSFHRVIGASGESVRIEGGRIYLNDEPFDEKSAPESTTPLPEYINLPRTVIPQNQLFALGGAGGRDSLGSFALIRTEGVIGRVTCVWMSQERARIGTEVR